MEEKKKKTAEEKAREGYANKMLNMIIGKTFARHSAMSEDEFLKDIGFEGSGKTEDEAIRISILNLLTETTNQLIRSREKIKMITAYMKALLVDEKITEEEKKGE